MGQLRWDLEFWEESKRTQAGGLVFIGSNVSIMVMSRTGLNGLINLYLSSSN
jgi:hypothetical protein